MEWNLSAVSVSSFFALGHIVCRLFVAGDDAGFYGLLEIVFC